jgi:hypothetical protein
VLFLFEAYDILMPCCEKQGQTLKELYRTLLSGAFSGKDTRPGTLTRPVF